MRSHTVKHLQDHKRRPMPDDFPQKAREMTYTQILKYYKAGYCAVWRWYNESGLPVLSIKEYNQRKKNEQTGANNT